MKKIILTRAHYPWHQTTPPLGLGYLAAYLDAHTTAAVRIIDGHRLRMSPAAQARMIASEQPDMVGISCLTAEYWPACELSKHLVAAGISVVIGGIHPTFLPEDTLRDSCADYVIMGEGELALAALVNGNDSAPGILKSGGVVGEDHGLGPVVPDLDTLPLPAWGLMPPATYPRAAHGALTQGYPVGVVVTSRGCPYNCSFCSSPKLSGRTIRHHSAENTVEHIRMLVEGFGVREIHFEDDNLTLKRRHIESICTSMIDSGIRVPWACPNGVRADRVDRDLLRLMKEAGCYQVAFGIESADQQILNMLDKGETIERVRQAIDEAEQVGISTQGFFILGLPGETKTTMERTLQWAISSKLRKAQFIVLDILPGSRLWTDLQGQFTPNWHKESYCEAEWAPPGLTPADLKAFQARAMRKFYLRFRRAWGLLKLVRPGSIGPLIGRLLRFGLRRTKSRRITP